MHQFFIVVLFITLSNNSKYFSNEAGQQEFKVLIDTHCHINILIKKKFDTPITAAQLPLAQQIAQQAEQFGVTHIINVGTSVIESENCIMLARHLKNNYAVVGIHPNDCGSNWLDEFKKIQTKAKQKKEHKIVGIGECGLDYHYPNYNKKRQKDSFKAHIELSLECELPLVIHTRDAGDDTLELLEPFKNENIRGVFHCFSQNKTFADYAINQLQFLLGIGGTVTYPKNDSLRAIVKKIGLEHIILETDAPYMPPQTIRGKKNHPKEIRTIAEYLAGFLDTDFKTVAEETTTNACALFGLEKPADPTQ